MRQEKNQTISGPLQFTVEQIQHYPFHVSGNLRVIYALKGSLNIFNVSGSSILKEDDIEFISADEPVELRAMANENAVIVMEVSRDYLEKIDPSIGKLILNVSAAQFFPSEERHLDAQNTGNTERLKGMFLSLFEEYRREPSGGFNEKNLELFCRFSIEHFNDMKKHLACLPHVNEYLIQRFLRIDNYLLDNLKEKITLSDLAGNEYLSPQYLSAEFRNKYNRTFGSILEYYRIVMAVRLILTQDLKVAQLVELCGFSDSKYFYRAFRSHMGCTPSEFRAKVLCDGGLATHLLELDSEELEALLGKAQQKEGPTDICAEGQVGIHGPARCAIHSYHLMEAAPGVYLGQWKEEGFAVRQYCLVLPNSEGRLVLEEPELWFFHFGGSLEVCGSGGETWIFGGKASCFLSLSAGQVQLKDSWGEGEDFLFFSRVRAK